MLGISTWTTSTALQTREEPLKPLLPLLRLRRISRDRQARVSSTTSGTAGGQDEVPCAVHDVSARGTYGGSSVPAVDTYSIPTSRQRARMHCLEPLPRHAILGPRSRGTQGRAKPGTTHPVANSFLSALHCFARVRVHHTADATVVCIWTSQYGGDPCDVRLRMPVVEFVDKSSSTKSRKRCALGHPTA